MLCHVAKDLAHFKILEISRYSQRLFRLKLADICHCMLVYYSYLHVSLPFVSPSEGST
jgi:hypothetical protein